MGKNYITTHRIFLLAVLLLGGVLVFQTYPIKNVAAGTGDNVSGWAWSENIGWISLNSTNQGGGTNYGVTIANNGDISGYGWSENIGWVSFNSADVAGCPSAPCAPKLNTTTGSISGWARTCAGTVNGNCTGGSRTDGWDGWIHLAGTATDGPQTPYGLLVTGTNLGGFAWGSDVLGWIHFYAVVALGDYTLSNSGNITVIPGFSGGSNTISLTLVSGLVSPITLSATGLPGGATISYINNPCTPTCAILPTISATSGTQPNTYPITITGTPGNKTTTFNLIVANPVYPYPTPGGGGYPYPTPGYPYPTPVYPYPTPGGGGYPYPTPGYPYPTPMYPYPTPGGGYTTPSYPYPTPPIPKFKEIPPK